MSQAQEHLKINTDLCTACRACEIACHYHHEATFGTSASSIRVDFDGDTGNIRIQFDKTCDSCRSEPEPMCVRFCQQGAILIA